MTKYKPREGDKRPLEFDQPVPLKWRIDRSGPFRWLPRHGKPFCKLEWFTQKMVLMLAFLPVYTAIIVTIVLIIQIFGVPFVDGV